MRNRGSYLRAEFPLLGCKFHLQLFQNPGHFTDFRRLGPFLRSDMLMERGNRAGPAVENDMQIGPNPKTYVDLQGRDLEMGHSKFIEQKARAPN